jgi:hypothetical protein
LGSVGRAQSYSREVFTADWLYVGATFAHESISVRTIRRRGGAKGRGTYSATDELDFLLTQGTSAPAKQYSVLVIHGVFSFHHWGPLSRPELDIKIPDRAQAQPGGLTADFANVLISIRRRRAGAERESNKSSIHDFGFCRGQFASTSANQYPVLVIHFFSFH